MWRVVSVLLALVWAVGFAQAAPYRLKPGDVLEVNVWQEPKLNKQIVVAPDGRIAFPLVGHLNAGGMTVEGVEAAIKAGLAKQYTTDIDVNVALIGVKEKPKSADDAKAKEYPFIYVTGEVNKPGMFEIRRATDIVQAISMSGGLAPFAAGRRIKVKRDVDGRAQFHDFDYDAFVSGKDVSSNIRLHGGDVIIVPERGLFE